MRDTLPYLLDSDFPDVKRDLLDTLQVNLGYKCNQQCFHCHVNASPKRKEMMSGDIILQIINLAKKLDIKTVDLTGGAPELHMKFRYLVSQLVADGVHVIDRCNLTILNEPDQTDLADFLAHNKVEIIASLPCYTAANVDQQRGDGVFAGSLQGLKKLNQLGYGKPGSGLQLNLVYNPTGAFLPPSQPSLEHDYKQKLKAGFNIEFNNLYTITNMPIKRFGSTLLSNNEFDDYMALLKRSHNVQNTHTVMCKNLLSIDWQGYVYDCDFNQMLGLNLQTSSNTNLHISELCDIDIQAFDIITADHCYGCTAGSGSSCGGALSA